MIPMLMTDNTAEDARAKGRPTLPEDIQLEKIKHCRERWKDLRHILDRLYQERSTESRTGDQERLDRDIADKEKIIQTVERELTELTSHLLDKIEKWVQAAKRYEENEAFTEAIKVWEEVKLVRPEYPSITPTIQRLRFRVEQDVYWRYYLLQLGHRKAEIGPVYDEVTSWIQQMQKAGSGGDPVLRKTLDDFIYKKIDADLFIARWQRPASSAPGQPNYGRLADRLKRGDLVLFMGSDIYRLSDTMDTPTPDHLAPKLVREANYSGFCGSLSMICEYYQMNPDFGRSRLLQEVNRVIRSFVSQIGFYESLARLERPLVIISAAYDTFLESVFRRNNKRYALVSFPMTKDKRDSREGKSLVQRSDHPRDPRMLRLSGLGLLESGYSLIYKIRGCCHWDSSSIEAQYNTLLTEGDFFAFARHVDTLLPDYLTTQIKNRGLCFLGYAPRFWEDRLLADVILDKRLDAVKKDPPFTVFNDDDDEFLKAWWTSRVTIYQTDLKTFVDELGRHLSEETRRER